MGVMKLIYTKRAEKSATNEQKALRAVERLYNSTGYCARPPRIAVKSKASRGLKTEG